MISGFMLETSDLSSILCATASHMTKAVHVFRGKSLLLVDNKNMQLSQFNTLLNLTYLKSMLVQILYIFLTCWHLDATSTSVSSFSYLSFWLGCFVFHFFAFFKTCSSYIWQFYYHSQYILDQYTRSRRYGTSDIWMPPWTHRIFYTGVWTCSHQNKPQYTCVLCHWNKVREHYCWEQTHFGGVAGLQSLKMKPDSHDVKVLLQQGRKRCSSSAECLLLWAPGREKGLAHEAPPLCSLKLEVCHYNFEDYTYQHNHSTHPKGSQDTAYTPCSRNNFLLQVGTGRAPE